MSELGKIYEMAEKLVLCSYATDTGPKGQSQAWKIAAIASDRAAGKDSSILSLFVDDIEKEVDRLLATQPIVTEVPKKASEPKKLVSVEPPQPHGGLDLNKN